MPDPAVGSAVDQSIADDRMGRRESATRRTVLRAAGLVTLVGGTGVALAACSSDTSATPGSSGAQSSADSSPSAASGEPSSASPSAPETPAASSPKPTGGGVILPNADYVVTQPEKGTYKAFSKICTHQGCPVAMITNREIVCKCHNSHFSITDGSVVSGPANKPLPSAKTTISGDKVVITG